MQLGISHNTSYRYDQPVPYGLFELRLTPLSGSGQSVLEWETLIEGGTKELDFVDQHLNRVELISVDAGQTEVTVVSRGVVETTDTGGVTNGHAGYTPLWLFLRPTPLTTSGKGIERLVASLTPASECSGVVEQMHQLSNRIAELVTYETGRSHSASTAEAVLNSGHGVCQDHAHIFISAARSLGVPARYVSGYLMMSDRIDQDATHAWAEAWLDGLGWVGFDASNGISPDENYVKIATGLDYQEAAPISGVRMGSSAEAMHVSLQVQQQ